jgi:hypothetical protein
MSPQIVLPLLFKSGYADTMSEYLSSGKTNGEKRLRKEFILFFLRSSLKQRKVLNLPTNY